MLPLAVVGASPRASRASCRALQTSACSLRWRTDINDELMRRMAQLAMATVVVDDDALERLHPAPTASLALACREARRLRAQASATAATTTATAATTTTTTATTTTTTKKRNLFEHARAALLMFGGPNSLQAATTGEKCVALVVVGGFGRHVSARLSLFFFDTQQLPTRSSFYTWFRSRCVATMRHDVERSRQLCQLVRDTALVPHCGVTRTLSIRNAGERVVGADGDIDGGGFFAPTLVLGSNVVPGQSIG